MVNDTLESISLDLGFSGSTLAEGTKDFLQICISRLIHHYIMTILNELKVW